MNPVDRPENRPRRVPRVLVHVILWLAPALVLLSFSVESKPLWKLTLIYNAFVVGVVMVLSTYTFSMTQIRKWGWYGRVWLGVYVLSTLLIVQALSGVVSFIGWRMGLWELAP